MMAAELSPALHMEEPEHLVGRKHYVKISLTQKTVMRRSIAAQGNIRH